MKVTETKDFKYSLHCLDCVYEDLGYNGKMLCIPKTKQCQPIFSYDMMIKSKLRKLDIFTNKGTSEQDKNKALQDLYNN